MSKIISVAIQSSNAVYEIELAKILKRNPSIDRDTADELICCSEPHYYAVCMEDAIACQHTPPSEEPCDDEF